MSSKPNRWEVIFPFGVTTLARKEFSTLAEAKALAERACQDDAIAGRNRHFYVEIRRLRDGVVRFRYDVHFFTGRINAVQYVDKKEKA